MDIRHPLKDAAEEREEWVEAKREWHLEAELRVVELEAGSLGGGWY